MNLRFQNHLRIKERKRKIHRLLLSKRMSDQLLLQQKTKGSQWWLRYFHPTLPQQTRREQGDISLLLLPLQWKLVSRSPPKTRKKANAKPPLSRKSSSASRIDRELHLHLPQYYHWMLGMTMIWMSKRLTLSGILLKNLLKILSFYTLENSELKGRLTPLCLWNMALINFLRRDRRGKLLLKYLIIT